MPREPQVGDVYYDKFMDNLIAIKSDFETYYYGYEVDYIKVGNPKYWDIMMAEAKGIALAYNYSMHPPCFTLRLNTIEMMEYKGKLAPWYKRLFGTYFIPDKPND